MTTITRAELNPVILRPSSLLTKRRLSVTTTIDSAKERVALSITFIRRKKTKVQVKPGRKKTNMKPSIALTMDKGPGEAKANPKSSVIGDRQSTPYLPSLSLFSWDDI